MSEILSPLTSANTLQIPEETTGLIGWVIGLLFILGVSTLLRDRRMQLDRGALIWLAVLSLLVLILTPFVGILPRMAPTVRSGEVPFQHLMFFAAVPWMVAGGVLGILPAVLLAGVSGLWLAYLDTQNIFTPLILMGIAVAFSWSVRQSYRSVPFKWLRFPLLAAIISLLLTTPMVFMVLMLSTTGSTATRVAHAIHQLPVMLFILGGMALIGAAACVIVQAFAQERWGGKSVFKPAPAEVHYVYRFLAYAVPILLIASTGVLISSWTSAENNARRVLLRQMSNTTSIATESLSVLIEAGKTQLSILAADLQLVSGSPERVQAVMDHHNRMLLFFNQMALLDGDGNLITEYPAHELIEMSSSMDWAGRMASLSFETPVAIIMRTSAIEGKPIQVEFLTDVKSEPGDAVNYLWGLADFEGNWFAQPFLQAMDDLIIQGGFGQIIESGGEVLFQTAGEQIHSLDFNFSTAAFFQSVSEDGRLLAHYYQPVAGINWGVVSSLPEAPIHEMTWQATYPIFLIAIGGMGMVMLLVWFLVSPVATEMDVIIAVIDDASRGNFDFERLQHTSNHPMSPIRKALHNMLIRQKSQIDHQSELLTVSGRLAGQLSSQETMNTILASALVYGASSARLVLTDSAMSTVTGDTERRFGIGKLTRMLAYLDHNVLNLSRQEGFLFLGEAEIEEKLPNVKMMPDIATLILVPLRWKDLSLGALWVTFPDVPSAANDVCKYLQEIGSLASVSIVNTKTYAESHTTQTMMESIFDHLPEVVLIADQDGQVVFLNNKAYEFFKVSQRSMEQKTLSSLLSSPDLTQLKWREPTKPDGREIMLEDGRAYRMVSRLIRINQHRDGYLMFFKDLTRQKKQEAMKTEFVTTVSHELRSPLTLILGYAKILRLTGNLNDQQDAYISNIIAGVEEMKDLVQKLLDIGHLEGGDPLNIQSVNIEEISRRVVESMDVQAKQKNIHLTLNFPEAPIIVEADQMFLTQALKNLIENAVKFSKMGGEVVVSAWQTDDRVVVKVDDKGIGIAPLDQRNLFNKFSRTNSQSGTENEGSGLGLAIVKSIAERHGGKVWLESQLGKGSSFYFELPSKKAG